MEPNITQEPPKPTRTQSRLGIAAIIGAGLSLCMLLGYLVFFFIEIATGNPDPSLIYYVMIIALVMGGLLGLTGLVLGIVTLLQKNKKKLFPILAILAFLLVVLLMGVSFLSIFVFTA